MTSLSTTWKQHFTSLVGDEEGNKKMLEFSNALTASKSQRDRLLSLVEEIDSVVFIADEDGKINIIHSPLNFGGTRTRSKNKIACLLGLGPLATAVILNDRQAIEECEIATPTLDAMHACKTAEDFQALAAPPIDGEVTFPGAASFIPSPFLRNFVIESESNDPAEIVPLLFAEAKRFDADHADDQAYRDTAVSHAEDFALWAWGVMSKRVSETRFSIRPDDGELKNFADARHKECIFSSLREAETAAANPSTSTSEAVLRQLSNSMTMQNETNRESNELRKLEFNRLREKDEIKKDRLKKLHKSVTNMIIMASASYVSVGDEMELRVPTEPVESCKDFYACESTGLAEQELYEQFKALNIPDVDFAHGTVQAILAGILLYNVGGSPSNFSAFCFCKQNPVQSDGPSEALILHLAATQGRGRTIEEINSSTKQKTEAPTTFEDLSSRIKFIAGASIILFGAGSPLVLQLNKFRGDIKNNRMAIRARIVEDKLFATKILYAIDTRNQRWLGQCKEARDRADVDDRIINFDDILNPILNCQFNVSLPPVFALVNRNQVTSTTGCLLPATDPRKKRKRTEKDEGSIERAKKVDPAFALKDTEQWKDFCGVCQDSKPAWENKKMCIRWNIRGFCFDNCTNKDSHVEPDENPPAKKSELKTWMAKVRASR